MRVWCARRFAARGFADLSRHYCAVGAAANWIIVDARIHDEFVDRFTAHAKTLKYGDPKDPSVRLRNEDEALMVANRWRKAVCNSYTEFAPRCSKALPWLPRKAHCRK
jgi:hypothetical protein